MPRFKLTLTASSDREESLAIASIPPGQQFNPPLPAKLAVNQSNPVPFETSINLKNGERVVLIFRDSKSGELHQAGLTYENSMVRPYLSTGSAALATIAIWPQTDSNYQGKIDLGIVGSTPTSIPPLNKDPQPEIGNPAFHPMETQKFQAPAGQTLSPKPAPVTPGVESAMTSPTSAETFPDAFRPFHETISPPTVPTATASTATAVPTATASTHQPIANSAFSVTEEGFSSAPATIFTSDKAIQDQVIQDQVIQDKAIQDKAIQDKAIQGEVTTEIQPPTVSPPQPPETKPDKAGKK